MRPESDKKIVAYYVSLLEFGRSILCLAEAWIPLAIVRAEVVKDQVLGGYGAVLRCLLRQMFLGPLGISAAGVVLPLEGEATLITISFSNFLGDEEFLNKSLDCKGASGLLCCMG